MKRIPCLYAIVRFSPFVETGEFANVGVILMAPAPGIFTFKLAIKRHERITHFFRPLDAKIYRETMLGLRDELNRANTEMLLHQLDKFQQGGNGEFATLMFNEIIRPRETTIKFSESRSILTSDISAELNRLYEHYVEHSFVTHEYHETVMERGVRQLLLQGKIADRFSRMEVGNEEYHAAFPFVEKHDDVPVTAIKPLNLDQSQASKILDHGGQWLFRVQALKKRDLLPRRILFAVKGPAPKDVRASAAREIVESLEDSGVTVLPYSATDQILEFASTH
jgi:hypothetical protein